MAGMRVRSGFAKSPAESGDVDLYYEDMGDPNDPAVLLIMGLGAQMLLWRTGFCEKLVNQGLRVIRYDNRDVGLSTKLSGRRVDSPLPLRMARSFLGLRVRRSTRSKMWPTTLPPCSITSTSTLPTSSAVRWAG